MQNKLILFDIDETLIDSGKAGTRAFNNAFAEPFGIEDAGADLVVENLREKEACRNDSFKGIFVTMTTMPF
jgi:beta-phosphoglucomutase-like phosphatase (HAD superfamily)